MLSIGRNLTSVSILLTWDFLVGGFANYFVSRQVGHPDEDLDKLSDMVKLRLDAKA